VPKQSQSSAVRVKKSAIGRGAFAARDFKRRETIGEVTGAYIQGDDYDPEYCIDMGEAGSLDPASPFRYLNHSCEPNCQLIEFEERNHPDGTPRLWVWALRSIRAGEELTIDYAWPAEDPIRCHCGSSKCRGWVVDKGELKFLKKVAKKRKARTPRS
jgi:uncharacterized protein